MPQPPPPDTVLDAALRMWGDREEAVTCTLTGACMAPWLPEGADLIIALRTPRLRLGDVVMVRTTRGALILRVVRVSRAAGAPRYLLKPDREWAFHGPVGAEDILGVVTGVRTTRGAARLDTFPRRLLGRWIAWRSHVSGRTHRPDTAFWKAAAVFADAGRRLRALATRRPNRRPHTEEPA